MSESGGQRGPARAFQRYLNKFQGPDIRLGQLILLWGTAMIAVLLACTAFFVLLFWLFN